MRIPTSCRVLLVLPFFILSVLAAQTAPQAPATAVQADWSAVDKTLGRAGKPQPDGAYKVAFPRTDLHVTVGRTVVEPAAALGSWMAFKKQGTGVVTNGDLAVLVSEIAPVSKSLQQHGFEITAVHNHLTGEQPSVFFIHFFRQGELQPLLDGLKATLAVTQTPTKAAPSSASINYDRATIEKVLGKAGTANGAVLTFGFPRREPISMHGIELPPSMGMATAFNFQPAATGVAATGDFVLKEDEVDPVTAALRDHGMTVTAVHNHMLGDSPHMIFVHFWAEGKEADVAGALKSALDATQR
jgi:hypothetical protein